MAQKISEISYLKSMCFHVNKEWISHASFFYFHFSSFSIQTGNLNSGQCTSDTALQSLLEDLFMGHEIIPDIVDKPPQFPLELTYKTVRTFPGMKLTADMTRFKPMLHWPAKNNALYTVILSNLDINNRRNRYTFENFCHIFVSLRNIKSSFHESVK